VLINITGGEDLTILEVNQAAEIIAEAADQDAEIIFGTAINPEMKEEIKITVIATGFNREREQEKVRPNVSRSPSHASTAPRSDSLKVVGAPPVEDDLDIPSFLRKKR
jgi:cell division protein FtsZ